MNGEPFLKDAQKELKLDASLVAAPDRSCVAMVVAAVEHCRGGQPARMVTFTCVIHNRGGARGNVPSPLLYSVFSPSASLSLLSSPVTISFMFSFIYLFFRLPSLLVTFLFISLPFHILFFLLFLSYLLFSLLMSSPECPLSFLSTRPVALFFLSAPLYLPSRQSEVTKGVTHLSAPSAPCSPCWMALPWWRRESPRMLETGTLKDVTKALLVLQRPLVVYLSFPFSMFEEIVPLIRCEGFSGGGRVGSVPARRLGGPSSARRHSLTKSIIA